MSKLWQRYLLKEVCLFLLLVICSLYFLYVLIDYAAHAKALHRGDVHFFSIISYYLCQFTRRAELLLPLSLLLATTRVLTTLHNEMTALRVGGISQKKLLRPFLFVACLVMMLFYVNFEYVQPRALAMIEHFEKQYFSEHARVYTRKVHALTLQDHSLLLYQNYDEKEHLFKDVYWIKNEEEIFRIKQLSFASSPFVGFYVDHLKRLSTGEIRRVETHERLSFPQIILSAPLLQATLRPPSMQSLSQLFHTMRTKQLFFTQKKVSDHDAESRALFYFKLFLPITALLAVIGPAPFCLRICRTLPLFWIYAFSLAGMVTLYTLLHSLYILSESQVLPAWIFLSLPFLFLCAILRLRNPST